MAESWTEASEQLVEALGPDLHWLVDQVDEQLREKRELGEINDPPARRGGLLLQEVRRTLVPGGVDDARRRSDGEENNVRTVGESMHRNRDIEPDIPDDRIRIPNAKLIAKITSLAGHLGTVSLTAADDVADLYEGAWMQHVIRSA